MPLKEIRADYNYFKDSYKRADFKINIENVRLEKIPEIIIEKLLEEYKTSPVDARKKAKEQVALSLSKASALNYGVELKTEEIEHLIDNLFACETPNYSPDGKKVLTIVPIEDIGKMFF